MKKSLIFILNCFSILILRAAEQETQPANSPVSSQRQYVPVKPHTISAEIAKECEEQSNGEEDLENKCLCQKCWETVCGNLEECKKLCKCPDPRETGSWHS